MTEKTDHGETLLSGRTWASEIEESGLGAWPGRHDTGWEDPQPTVLISRRPVQPQPQPQAAPPPPPGEQPSGLLGFLIVQAGPQRGQVHRLRHGTRIGQPEADIVVNDPAVDRTHARFTFEEERFFVWDCGTDAGTFVNGRRIREATPLQENDTIQVGHTTFVLKTVT